MTAMPMLRAKIRHHPTGAIDGGRPAAASALAVESNAVKLHAVIDEAKTKLFRDYLLQRFEFGVDEFEHFTSLDIDKMIVMRFGRSFVP